MDQRPDERKRQALHALVKAARPLLLALVALSLVAGIAGGLVRVGVALPFVDAALAHAALMICSFLGSVIGIERAVAVRHRAAFFAPFASGLGGVALLAGQAATAAWLLVAASIAFVGVNLVVVRRQRADHTWLLVAGALCWLVGNLLFASGLGHDATLACWFAFLVLTIGAERLEMTRLMRRRPTARLALYVILAALVGGALGSLFAPAIGAAIYGSALALLALWLATFDIARRTVFTHGLSRYMALCLLGGYAWLFVAGLAWLATACGLPLRDVALHALGLGFIVSMMMGHVPVILPAVARVKLQFGRWFYLPLAALHLSLVVRLVAGSLDWRSRVAGAELNALAIAWFAATVAGAALAWRIRHGEIGMRNRGVVR